MRLAVIPARGGSKRIPKKNVKNFAGQPMLAWSIQAAIQSQCFDRIIVSTDDPEIAQLAIAFGADVPFMRPAELSDDHTPTTPVIAHAIDWQNLHGQSVSQACCIYATAPFIQASDLRQGLDLLNTTDADYAFAVTSYAFPIQRAIRITDGQRVEMVQPEYFGTRSQDLVDAFHDAGQFYWGKAEAWLNGKRLFAEHSAPIVLQRYVVHDLDTPADWKEAELFFEFMKFKGERT
jgi:N-acylneuraminate cytidylyltransferase